MSLIRIFTDKSLHSEIETADEVTKIEVEGELIFNSETSHNISFIQGECVNAVCLSHKKTNRCKIENCINRLASPK